MTGHEIRRDTSTKSQLSINWSEAYQPTYVSDCHFCHSIVRAMSILSTDTLACGNRKESYDHVLLGIQPRLAFFVCVRRPPVPFLFSAGRISSISVSDRIYHKKYSHRMNKEDEGVIELNFPNHNGVQQLGRNKLAFSRKLSMITTSHRLFVARRRAPTLLLLTYDTPH
jgi:hypothetical protein